MKSINFRLKIKTTIYNSKKSEELATRLKEKLNKHFKINKNHVFEQNWLYKITKY